MNIENFAPGLSGKTSIDVKNVSDEKIKYNISLEHTDGSEDFFNVLQARVKIDDKNEFEGSFAELEDIAMGKLGEGDSVPVNFDIHFPEKSGNKFQGENIKIAVKVDAKQVKDDSDSDNGDGGNSDDDNGDDGDRNNDDKDKDQDKEPDPEPDPDPEKPGKEPDTPDEPENPEEPGEEPDEPIEPDDPRDPEEPSDPEENPDNPEEKPEPEEPTDDETVTPGENDGGPGPGLLPETGETGSFFIYLTGITSLLTGAFLFFRSRQLKRKLI